MLSYALAALAYLLLLVAGLTFWRERLSGSSLMPAVGAQLVWAAVLAANAGGVSMPLVLIVTAEFMRALAWTVVLARALWGSSQPRVLRRALWLLEGSIAVALAGLLLVSATSAPEVGTESLVRGWMWGGLILSIAGLVLVEQVARNTRSGREWELKFIWLSIGALFAYDLCLFSITLLGGGAAPALWVVRGLMNATLAGLLAIGIRRVSRWESAAFTSPKLGFFNATLIGAGIYVLAMAAASYYIQGLGGSWGAVAQVAFLAGAALVMAVAVLSAQFRAWARVTFAKHFFPYRYDYRIEWQKLTRALSRFDDVPLYERVTEVMAEILDSAGAGLWLKDPDGVCVPVGGVLASPNAPREPASSEFLSSICAKEWIFDLEEARTAHSRERMPEPPEWLLSNPRFRLVVPLVCEDQLVGFVVLGQPLATMRLTWEEIDLLRAVGRQVASYLAFEQAAKRLAEAQQFEAVNRLSAVLMHDLRHLVAQQALVVQNAGRHRNNPRFIDDAILTIDDSVKRMSRLMDELRSGALTAQAHRVDLAELCAEVVKRTASRAPAPSLTMHERGLEVVANRDRLLSVLEHIVRNAQDATPASGTVVIGLRRVAQRAVIDVTDTGVGMDAEFIRTRLFRPFDTTKGSRGMGIGAYEAREFVRKCGGDVNVSSEPGKGTRFTISLRMASPLVATGTALRSETHAS